MSHSENLQLTQTQNICLQNGGEIWTSYGNFLKKLKTELLYDPPVQLLGIYPRGSIAFYRDFYICIFTADLFTIAGKWRQFRMANCRGMDNENVIYTKFIYYLSNNLLKLRIP